MILAHLGRVPRVLAAGAAVASLAMAGPVSLHAADVVFSSGPTGGSWIPMAAATAQVVKKRFPEVNLQVEPGAALVNMEKIRTDKADLGWSMTTVRNSLTCFASPAHL